MLSECDFPQGFNICNVDKQIEHIFSFFRCPKVVYPDSSVAIERPQRDLLQVCSNSILVQCITNNINLCTSTETKGVVGVNCGWLDTASE